MNEVKKYISFSVLLVIYVISMFVLLRSLYIYQSAYHALSRLISHSSVEILYEEEKK